MGEKISFNILGCCVLRDIFGMQEADGGYTVNRYVQIPSPVSCVTPSPLIAQPSDECFEGVSPFVKRCTVLELHKQVFDFLGGGADYLLVDAAEFRKNLYHFKFNDGWFTDSRKDVFDKLIKTGALPDDYEIVDPLDMDRGEVRDYIEAYCEKLLRLYEPDRIILCELKTVGFMAEGERLSAFGNASLSVSAKMNERMALAFSYMKHFLRGCHIIEFPENVYADACHKWGKGVLHYVPEYYDYALKAVSIIVDRNVRADNECQMLMALKRAYGCLLSQKLKDSVIATFSSIAKERAKAKKILGYEKFFKKCLMQNGQEEIEKFLKDHHITECAFYGRTQVTDVFVKWFREWGIQISAIIENLNKQYDYGNIRMVRKDSDTITDFSIIIICELCGELPEYHLREIGFEGKVYGLEEMMS